MYSVFHGSTLGESIATVADNSSHPIESFQSSVWRPMYAKDALYTADDPVVASLAWFMLCCKTSAWRAARIA